jgi:glycosyltransferase involved in cell wall biosynthesis
MRSLKMTNKKLLFIWNYHYFPFEKGKSRFSDLLEAFVKEGYQVEVVTSSFYHMGKTQRSIEDPKYQSFGYKVHFIPEPGYKKNVSFARVRSMNRFNTGVKRYLQKHDSVDAVYVPVPSIKLAAIAEKWCRITKAKCVIDVEDLWPESFQMIIKPKFLCKALTWPLMLQANKAYRKADAVVTVSQTYLNRVKQVREGKFPCAVAPIGADLDFVDRIQQNNHLVKPENEFWICYTGTLGTSYDLETVIDAVDLAHRQTLHTFVFKIMGQGPDEERLLQYAKLKEGRFDFMGLLPYEKMCEILQVSDLAVNPIIKESVASLINKVADYAACGIPVINTQTCQEYVSLLDCTYSGCTIQSQDPSSLAELFVRFSQDPLLVQTMKHNARTSLRPFFSRAESQKKILLLISELLK